MDYQFLFWSIEVFTEVFWNLNLISQCVIEGIYGLWALNCAAGCNLESKRRFRTCLGWLMLFGKRGKSVRSRFSVWSVCLSVCKWVSAFGFVSLALCDSTARTRPDGPLSLWQIAGERESYRPHWTLVLLLFLRHVPAEMKWDLGFSPLFFFSLRCLADARSRINASAPLFSSLALLLHAGFKAKVTCSDCLAKVTAFMSD